MIFFASDALLDFRRIRSFLETRNPDAAVRAIARVFVELGALTWPNGYDIDPIALHDRMSAAGELSREAAE